MYLSDRYRSVVYTSKSFQFSVQIRKETTNMAIISENLNNGFDTGE
jgi:hypothetical protein